MLKGFKRAIGNDSGDGSIVALIVIFFLFSVMVAVFQNLSVIGVTRTVHSVMQKTAISAVTENAMQTFASKREGFAGAYTYNESLDKWDEDAFELQVKSFLQEQLGLVEVGGALVKQESGSEIFRIENFSLSIENPNLTDTQNTLQSKLTLDLKMKVRFAIVESDVTIPLAVTAVNRNKFSDWF